MKPLAHWGYVTKPLDATFQHHCNGANSLDADSIRTEKNVIQATHLADAEPGTLCCARI